jgi:hypothetical protein
MKHTQIEFDHVGILVKSVMDTLERLHPHKWPSGAIETFPAEGTKEVYLGPVSASGRLLLIEPIGEGPYKEAWVKRGSGIHHIAINVDDVFAFMERIAGSSWYLHPKSLSTLKEHQTLWLARPRVPLLVEVVHRKSMPSTKNVAFVSQIEVPLPESKPLLTSAIGLEQFQAASEPDVFITIDEERRRLEELVG